VFILPSFHLPLAYSFSIKFINATYNHSCLSFNNRRRLGFPSCHCFGRG
jgi:hypothetical protein